MKKIMLMASLIVVSCLTFFACKKYAKDTNDAINQDLKNAKASSLLACTFETLAGDITSDRTLSATTTYKIDGCVTVKGGTTLNIPAGTRLLGMKTPSGGGKSVLIVEQGATLNISGTSTNPVIFTSDQAPGSRSPGDWMGLRIFGGAPNNNSNSLTIDLGCASYTGGGASLTDNSGTLEYFQVHFAGAPANGNDISKAAIMLNSVGKGTVFNHVQVSNPANDGFAIFGGNVKLENLVSYNADVTDFRYEFGYLGNSQFLAAMRLNNTAVPSAPAYGVEIRNNRLNNSASPATEPVISNLSVMGPNFCSNTPVNSNFMYAIRVFENGALQAYNNVVSKWNTAATSSGLIIERFESIAKTASNDLNFSYNSFDNSGSTPYIAVPTVSWTADGGCSTSMAAWISGPTPPACRETGNQFSVATLGYDPSFCSNYCSSFTSNFVLGTTTLSASNFSWDTGGAFAHPTYRGAFGPSDWTSTWADWCAQSKVYCE